MNDERDRSSDGRESKISDWLQRHAELVWYGLGIVFVIYGISALVNLTHGTPGPDDANVISTFGGFIAGVAAAIIGFRTAREKRNSPDDD